jgi:hypothetical protein
MRELVTAEDRMAACIYYGYDDEKDMRYWGNVSQHSDVERLAKAFARHRTNNHAELVEALRDLETAEYEYRKLHDLHGDGDLRTGRAWDWMRRKGDAARKALSLYTEGEGGV